MVGDAQQITSNKSIFHLLAWIIFRLITIRIKITITMERIADITHEGLSSLRDGKNYTVVFDLTEQATYITAKGKLNDKQVKIVDFVKPPCGNASLEEAHKLLEPVKNTIRSNFKEICYSTVKAKYGKKFADSIEPYKYVDNPYYKKGHPMKLYVEKVVEHLYSAWKSK